MFLQIQSGFLNETIFLESEDCYEAQYHHEIHFKTIQMIILTKTISHSTSNVIQNKWMATSLLGQNGLAGTALSSYIKKRALMFSFQRSTMHRITLPSILQTSLQKFLSGDCKAFVLWQ